MMQTVALIGAGGKMGCRCTDNLLKEDYRLLLCERGESGLNKIRQKGLEVISIEEAVPAADIVIMAVPDTLIGSIAKKITPMFKTDATMIILDAAAIYIGEVPRRKDITYVVTHPCHPPLFREQKTSEAKKDFFGGAAASQDIVIALVQGSEENFTEAEELCRKMFAPVDKVHRISLEQMAILEPALSEVVGAAAIFTLREAVDVAVDHGVPREAAESFILGHINVSLAMAFKIINAPLSDAAKISVSLGKDLVFKSDWKKVFRREMIRKVINAMLHPKMKSFETSSEK